MVDHNFLLDVDEYIDSLGDGWATAEDSDVELQCFRFAMERNLEDASKPVNALRLELERVKEPDKSHPLEIDNYLVMGKFGEGVSSVVYECFDERIENHVALKLAKPGSPTFADFSRESKFLSDLNHPNIGRFFTVGEYDGRPYLVSEAINGTTLLRAELASTDDKVRVVSRVLAGLIHANSKAIFHGDLKPGNILIDDAGVPKIVDWGGADWFSEEYVSGKRVDTFTRCYAAPERESNSSDLADQYSAGVILFELLTQKLPSDIERAEQILIEKKIDKSLRRICLKAMRVDPLDRFVSHDEFKRVLDKWLANQQAKPIRRKLSIAAAVVVSIAALCCIPLLMVPAFNSQLITPGLPAEFVPANDFRNITITSKPTGAEFRFITTDKQTVFEPDEDGTFELKPGEYFVTALWPDGQHVTAYRRVPTEVDVPQAICWLNFKSNTNGNVQLTTVSQPERFIKNPIELDGQTWMPEEIGVGLNFNDGTQLLEYYGYRMPLLSERQAVEIPGDKADLDEWTATISSSLFSTLGFREYKLNKYQQFAQNGNRPCVYLIRTPTVGVRGVRDEKPLGF